jgi:DNA-binding transcriptional regulator PaaX
MFENVQDRLKDFLESDENAIVTKVVVALVAVSAIFAVAAVAPNIFQVAKQFKGSRRYSKLQLQKAASNLKRKGVLQETKSKNGIKTLTLTKEGHKYLEDMVVWDIEIPQPKHWDGKWRFVIFDIPIKFTKAREALRWRLRTLGFYQYQKSVWVYPYPCEREIMYVANFFGVKRFVDLFEGQCMTRENELKKHFDLH